MRTTARLIVLGALKTKKKGGGKSLADDDVLSVAGRHHGRVTGTSIGRARVSIFLERTKHIRLINVTPVSQYVNRIVMSVYAFLISRV